MKNYFLVLFALTAFSSFSQTDFSSIKLEKDADYKPAERYALEASNYVLSVPLDSNNPKQAAATKFLLRWMEGTPDYTYAIDSPLIVTLDKENPGLLGVYFAGMTKFSLENKAKAQDAQLVMIGGIKTLLSYAQKSDNKVIMSDALKKLIEINNKGELEKAFK